MGLDTRYIPTKYFQEFFIDKDTECPMAGGTVKFYKDQARTEPKFVYIISGTPPNYVYTNIGWEVTLTGVGTFEYNNQDVTIYLFPYDEDGNIELYFAEVYNSGFLFQFSREGFPNIAAGEEDGEELINYISNGQFLLHHDIVADEVAVVEAGEITDDVTDIAEGGWKFERTSGSSAKDFVLFERIGSYVEVPSKSPRYALRVKNESPSGTDVFKLITATFRDVNKFASDTEKFTFSFTGKTSGGSSSIEVKLIKNYGTGGSAQEEIVLQAITLGSTYVLYDIPFVFGDNDGKTIGSLDDDYVQLVVSLPVAAVFDNTFDNFILYKGDQQITEFPDTSDAQFIRDSLAGWPPVPNYEGENLYLPIRLGLKGFEYDTGEIGKYVVKSTEILETSELWCDGTKYRIAAYSDDKIPYRRLYEKWSTNSDIGLSIYGTGDDEMRYEKEPTIDQSFATSDTDQDITNDSWQSFTAGNNDYLSAIEITLAASAPPANSRVDIYSGEGTTGTLLSSTLGLNFVAGANTINFGTHVKMVSGTKFTIRIRNAGTLLWRTNAAGGYAGGSFNGTAADAVFKTYTLSATADYNLKSNTGGAVVAAADGAVPTGFTFTPVQPDPYIVKITAVAASGMTAGAYFTYNTTDSRKYIPWYEIDGSGTKPVEAAAVYIKIAILSSDTADIVNNKTSLAINGYSMKIPDWRGYFIRVTDNKAGVDPESGIRTDRGDGRIGDTVGTVQQDAWGPFGTGVSIWEQGGASILGGVGEQGRVTPNTAGIETRPKNKYANFAVKY